MISIHGAFAVVGLGLILGQIKTDSNSGIRAQLLSLALSSKAGGEPEIKWQNINQFQNKTSSS